MYMIVIPAYNEGKHLEKVLKEVQPYAKDIIVVDDGSKDQTAEIAEQTGVTVLKHVVNLGKGAALKTGCDYAVQEGAKELIVMDGDGQHEAKDIPRFQAALKKTPLVLSYRVQSKNMPVIFRFGNWLITTLMQFMYGMNVQDTQSGFRAFTAEAYKKMRWNAQDYSMESEMLARAGKHHIPYTELSIQTIYGDKYKGTTVLDGVKIVANLIKWRLFS